MKHIVLSFLLLMFISTFLPPVTKAGDNGWACDLNLSQTRVLVGDRITVSSTNVSQNGIAQSAPQDDNAAFYLKVEPGYCGILNDQPCWYYIPSFQLRNGQLTTTLPHEQGSDPPFQYPGDQVTVSLVRNWGIGDHELVCSATETVQVVQQLSCESGDFVANIPATIDRSIPTTVSISSPTGNYTEGQPLYVFVRSGSAVLGGSVLSTNIGVNGTAQVSIDVSSLTAVPNGNYSVEIKDVNDVNAPSCNTPQQFTLIGETSCIELGQECNEDDERAFCSPTAICGDNGLAQLPQLSTFEYACLSKNPPTCSECEVFPDGTRTCLPSPPEKSQICYYSCNPVPTWNSVNAETSSCPADEQYIDTAIGCINYDVIGFSRFLLGWSMGVGGGVALVLIAFAGIQMMLSMGNPDRLNNAKGLFVAAMSGLFLILLATFLLRIIGVDILALF